MTGRTNSTCKDGVILIAVILVMLALGLLAGSLSLVATVDVRMVAYFKRAVDALYTADTAVHYFSGVIESNLADGTLVLDSPVESVNWYAPSGMTFNAVHELVQTSDTNAYYFLATGQAVSSRATVQAVFRQISAFEMGMFGDTEVDTKAYGAIYSYNSGDVSNPTPADSTGTAMASSNGDFLTHQDTLIDGSLMLGSDSSGTDGEWSELPSGGSVITGDAALQTDRIEPDPLGAIDGELAASFVYYSDAAYNSNSAAIPPITPPNNKVIVPNGNTLDLTSGSYYISSMVIRNGATVNIDASSGPVDIYLTGQLEAKEGSIINISGDPTDLHIYSNSDRPITIKHDGGFKGLIYAPLADITIMNSGDFLGLAWGASLELKSSGWAFMDRAVTEQFLTDSIRIVSWKELR